MFKLKADIISNIEIFSSLTQTISLSLIARICKLKFSLDVFIPRSKQ